MTVMTSREFSEDLEKAKDAALDGPVIIVDRGREAYVLMTAEEFRQGQSQPRKSASDAFAVAETATSVDMNPQRVEGARPSLADLLSMPAEDYFDFELPPREPAGRPIDLDD